MGLSLAKQLILPYKMVVLSAKFTILSSWPPFCTPLIPCHYQLKDLQKNLATTTEQHGGWPPLPGSLHKNKRVREEIIYIFYF